MTHPASDVSVVICAYTQERWTFLLQAIESVKRQTCAPREIIVAVDHNSDLSRRLREGVSGIVIRDSLGAKGKSGALNTAIADAKGSIIALLDDDAAAEPSWLAELTQGYDDPRILGVGGHLEPVWPAGQPRWFPSEFLWVVGCTYIGMPRERSVVRNLIGANMSFRRDVFIEAGGSRAGMGPDGTTLVGAARAEDTEFCVRATQKWPHRFWVYEPRAKVRHHVPPSRAQWSYFRSRCYVEGLSKAVLDKVGGGRKVLRIEQHYASRTLPAGVTRGIADVLLRRDPAGIARAGAIVAGLGLTTAGYLAGRYGTIATD